MIRAGSGTAPWPLLAVLFLAGCRWPITLTVAPAGPSAPSSIDSWLTREYAPPNPKAAVFGLAYLPPETGGRGSLRLRLVPDGTLPPAGLRPARPADARAEPGLYLGTFEMTTGQPRYLARLGGPGAVLGEGDDHGTFGGVLVPSPRTVVAGRFPLVPTDLIAMFDSDGTSVTRVYWMVDSRKDFPRWVKRYVGLVAE